MAPKLRKEEIVTLQVLRDKGLSFREIATTLGVSEGTVRYHRKRRGQPDGRGKPRKAQALANVIDAWMLQHTGSPDGPAVPRPVNVLDLCGTRAPSHRRTVGRVIPWWVARPQSPPPFHPARGK